MAVEWEDEMKPPNPKIMDPDTSTAYPVMSFGVEQGRDDAETESSSTGEIEVVRNNQPELEEEYSRIQESWRRMYPRGQQ